MDKTERDLTHGCKTRNKYTLLFKRGCSVTYISDPGVAGYLVLFSGMCTDTVVCNYMTKIRDTCTFFTFLHGVLFSFSISFKSRLVRTRNSDQYSLLFPFLCC